MTRSLHVSFALIFGMALYSETLAQTSLKEIAREHNGSATSVINQMPPLLSWEELTGKSDVIVRGRVVKSSPHLSDDESVVYTEYTIQPTEVLKGSESLAQSQRPGMLPPLILQHIGGLLVVDGLRLRTQTDFDDGNSRLARGGEYIFCLSRVSESPLARRVKAGVYELAAGPYAIFSIENGRIVSFTKRAAERQRLPSSDAEAFVAKVRALVSGK